MDDQIDIGILTYNFLDKYQTHISNCAHDIFKDNPVGIKYFKFIVQSKIEKIFSENSYREEKYLLKIVSNLKKSELHKYSQNIINNKQFSCCPFCGDFVLLYKKNQVFCECCHEKFKELDSKPTLTNKEKTEHRLSKIFSKHSKSSHLCPDCNRFVPDSYIDQCENSLMSCIYDDCFWIGDKIDLKQNSYYPRKNYTLEISRKEQFPNGGAVESIYPHRASSGSNIPDSVYGLCKSSRVSDGGEHDRIDIYKKSNSVITLTSVLEDIEKTIQANEDVQEKSKLVKKVIRTQKLKIKADTLSSLKKIFMYQAFERVIEKDPVRLVYFLTNMKGSSGRSSDGIQREVFSKYIQIIQENLPINIENKTYTHLLDDGLKLFLGESEFTSIVQKNNVIENHTIEMFSVHNQMIPCFLGHLIDVRIGDQSIMDKVLSYGFSLIKMSPEVPPGTLVNVVHYRIPPHHEQFSLVPFKRIKLKIKESIAKYLEKENQND